VQQTRQKNQLENIATTQLRQNALKEVLLAKKDYDDIWLQRNVRSTSDFKKAHEYENMFDLSQEQIENRNQTLNHSGMGSRQNSEDIDKMQIGFEENHKNPIE